MCKYFFVGLLVGKSNTRKNMTAEEFIEKVKSTLGELLPSDLIFEIQDGKINFYNEITPKSNSTLDFSEITSDEYDFYIESCVHVIKSYHIK